VRFISGGRPPVHGYKLQVDKGGLSGGDVNMIRGTGKKKGEKKASGCRGETSLMSLKHV